MTAPTMPAVLRLAADQLGAPTFTAVRTALHLVADPIDPAMAERIADVVEAHEAEDGWPVYCSVLGLAVHLRTLADALAAELVRTARRKAVHACTSCGGPASSILCNACYWEIVDDSHRPARHRHPWERPMTETDSTKLATEMADQFRQLAALLEANPELAREFSYPLRNMNVPVTGRAGGGGRDAVVAFARAGLAAGATVSKDFSEKWAGVRIELGEHVRFHVYAARDEVCERVVTGTREETVQVPDPEALAAVPTTSVTKVVETVEWVCRPLLASEAADNAAALAGAEAQTAGPR